MSSSRCERLAVGVPGRFTARKWSHDLGEGRISARAREFALAGDFACVRRFAPQDEEEERRFPGAVGSHEADAVLAVYLQRHIGEQRPPGESFGQSTDCQHPKRGMLLRRSGWRKRAVGAGRFRGA